jgi:hypothetical protein
LGRGDREVQVSGNPMRWRCFEKTDGGIVERDGCFNVKKRPKLEVFHDCFTHGINFGDVDGLVERRGHFLFVEWKPPGGVVCTAQRRVHEELVKLPRVTVITAFGDAETMTVEFFTVRTTSGVSRVDGDLETLKAYVACWFEHVEAGEEIAAVSR